MDLHQALIQRLSDDGGVRALVAERFFWVSRPQQAPNNALPAIVLQVISEDRTQNLDGFDDMRTARVQIAALALRYGQARHVIESAIAALVPEATVETVTFWEASVKGPRDTSEDVAGTGLVHRTLADLIIRYSLEA